MSFRPGTAECSVRCDQAHWRCELVHSRGDTATIWSAKLSSLLLHCVNQTPQNLFVNLTIYGLILQQVLTVDDDSHTEDWINLITFQTDPVCFLIYAKPC